MSKKQAFNTEKTLPDFLDGKSLHTIALFNHFVEEYKRIGRVTLHPAKTMIGIATSRKRIVYITQLGRDFIHVVFPFEKPYAENLCFQKIAQVPGDAKQFNHHFRMYAKEDVNKEVLRFMKLAYQQGT
jgi:hypothetical protein